MTTKISYGPGYRDDCNLSKPEYHETENPNGPWVKQTSPTLTATLTNKEGDFYMIDATSGSGSVYWENDIDNRDPGIYKKFLFRYATSSSNIKAKIELIFTGGSQIVLDESSSIPWAYGCVDVDDDKGDVDKIRIYATSGAGEVLYDFLLLTEGFWQIPYVSRDGKSGGVDLSILRDVVKMKPPGRSVIHQDLGLGQVQIRLIGDMDTRSEWKTNPVGSPLYQILLDGGWQWFDSDLIKCKVLPVDFKPSLAAGSGKQRLWGLTLEQYSVASSASVYYSGFDFWGF